MSRPGRRLAAVLISAALAACYRDPVPVTPVQPEPRSHPDRAALTSSDPLGFLPVESEVVAVIETRQLRASAVWKRFEPALMAKAGPMLVKFKAACGFDPLAALRRISLGIHHLDAPKPTGVVVLKGIDRTSAMACMDRARAADPSRITVVRSDAGGDAVREIVSIPGSDGDPPTVFTFVDAATLVFLIGPAASPAGLADVVRRGVPLRESPAFLDLLAHVEINDPLWFLFGGSSQAFDKAAMLGFKPRAITCSLSLTNGLSAVARIRLDAPDQATQIAMMAQGQLQAVASMVDEIGVSADEADVVVRLRMTQEQVDSILGLFGGLLGP
ncbi:MAG: hypothetical protein H6Q90_4610 [Deltaproteobacteria bacterium]|nr:hypothetical protein [Deltaproteobacteria bacterium]